MDIMGGLHTLIIDTLGMAPWVDRVAAGLLKSLAILGFILLNALFLIWLERKVGGHIQNRPGPLHVGWHGALQTIADTFKLLTKEDVIPNTVDRWVFKLAPIVTFAPAMMVFVVIPFGRGFIVRDLNIALIYVSAATSVIVISYLMAGWASNNKWSLLGAMRSAAQLVSYEVPLALSVVAVAMLAGSLSLQSIVEAQRHSVWFILLQPLGFISYFVAALAELNRAPFDLPEAESELVAGFNTEYSGMRWAFFFLAEYAGLVSSSAIAATLYFGGWSGPFLPPVVWWTIKTYAFVFVAMWIRFTLPRIRVDQLMGLSWKVLIPMSIVNLLITGIIVLVR